MEVMHLTREMASEFTMQARELGLTKLMAIGHKAIEAFDWVHTARTWNVLIQGSAKDKVALEAKIAELETEIERLKNDGRRKKTKKAKAYRAGPNRRST